MNHLEKILLGLGFRPKNPILEMERKFCNNFNIEKKTFVIVGEMVLKSIELIVYFVREMVE